MTRRTHHYDHTRVSPVTKAICVAAVLVWIAGLVWTQGGAL